MNIKRIKVILLGTLPRPLYRLLMIFLFSQSKKSFLCKTYMVWILGSSFENGLLHSTEPCQDTSSLLIMSNDLSKKIFDKTHRFLEKEFPQERVDPKLVRQFNMSAMSFLESLKLLSVSEKTASSFYENAQLPLGDLNSGENVETILFGNSRTPLQKEERPPFDSEKFLCNTFDFASYELTATEKKHETEQSSSFLLQAQQSWKEQTESSDICVDEMLLDLKPLDKKIHGRSTKLREFAQKCKKSEVNFSSTEAFKKALEKAKIPFKENTTFYDAYNLVRSRQKGEVGRKSTWKRTVDKLIKEEGYYLKAVFFKKFSSLKGSTKSRAWQYYQEHKDE